MVVLTSLPISPSPLHADGGLEGEVKMQKVGMSGAYVIVAWRGG